MKTLTTISAAALEIARAYEQAPPYLRKRMDAAIAIGELWCRASEDEQQEAERLLDQYRASAPASRDWDVLVARLEWALGAAGRYPQ